MRAAARELVERRTLPAPVGVAALPHQLPRHAVRVQVADDGRGRVAHGHAGAAPSDAAHLAKWRAALQRIDELQRRFLALAAHDGAAMRLAAQDFFPVVGGIHAAEDDVRARQQRTHAAGHLVQHRLRRRGAGMPQQHRIRARGGDLLRERLRRRIVKIAVKELHLVPRVNQRPADGQQAERRQMLARHAGTDGRMCGVDEGDFHGRDDTAAALFRIITKGIVAPPARCAGNAA